MDINVINNMVDFICNRAQTGNTTPARKNMAYNMANLIMYRKYFGLPENWLPGQAIAFSVSQQDEEIMSTFKVPKSLYIDTNGDAAKPDDFIHASTMTYIASKNGKLVYNPVKICNDAEFQEVLSSYVIPADKDNPACNFRPTTIRFAPVDLVNCEMIYLRIPATPVWGFTVTSGRPIYDPSASVQPEWQDDLTVEFVTTAAQSLGVNMQREELYAMMSQYKNNKQ